MKPSEIKPNQLYSLREGVENTGRYIKKWFPAGTLFMSETIPGIPVRSLRRVGWPYSQGLPLRDDYDRACAVAEHLEPVKPSNMKQLCELLGVEPDRLLAALVGSGEISLDDLHELVHDLKTLPELRNLADDQQRIVPLNREVTQP